MTPLTLPRELTIDNAAECRDALLATLGAADAGPWVADAAAIAEVDSAGVQLLLSLARSAADAGCELRIHAPSRALAAACLGLGVELPFVAAEVAP